MSEGSYCVFPLARQHYTEKQVARTLFQSCTRSSFAILQNEVHYLLHNNLDYPFLVFGKIPPPRPPSVILAYVFFSHKNKLFSTRWQRCGVYDSW